MKGKHNEEAENEQVASHGKAVTENIGDSLKKARKAKNMTLEEVSQQTRIPLRHLEAIEANSTKGLPATTYSAGFVKSYAQLLNLDGAEMAARFRETMGEATRQQPMIEPYAPADPTRVPPLRLIIPCLVAAVVVIVGGVIWNRHHVDASLYSQNSASSVTNSENENNLSGGVGADNRQSQAIAATTEAKGKVTLTASNSVWIRIYDGKGGPVLLEKTLNAGEPVSIAETAKNPMLQTSHPEFLTIAVDNKALPASILPKKRVKDFSLLESNLLKAPIMPTLSSSSATPSNASSIYNNYAP